MILPASYSNGFAPRDGQPLYPQLWRGCVFAAAPCLGPTGAVLYDWSKQSNATLSAPATAFTLSGSRYSLSAGFGTVASSELLDTVQSVSMWLRPAGVSGFLVAASRDSNIGSSRGWYIARSTATLNIAVWNNSGTLRNQTTASILTADQWYHVAFSWDGVNVDIYVNGKYVMGGTLSGTPRTVAVDMKISALGNNGSVWTGSTDDVRAYDCPINTIVPLLATRRGIAYEMAPRRRSRAAVITSGFSALRPSILRGSR